MTVNPYVELTFSDIHPESIRQATTGFLGNPRELIESGLMTYRLLMVNYIKREMARHPITSPDQFVKLADTASQLYLGRLNKVIGPAAMQAYMDAYKAVGAGDVPPAAVYALAEQHVNRMGTYFHESSKEALVTGFNSYMNRQIPMRVAADRALDAYGLTPRQMSGYVALEPELKVRSTVRRAVKARALEYVSNSIRSRLKIFATQELHNMTMQAQQTAWLWMQQTGKLSPYAEKIWLTAKDEKVCKVCGPMHGKVVLASEKFTLPAGDEIWVPGVHPNCRCEVTVREPLAAFQKDLEGGDLEEFNDEHPRDKRGRFSAKTRFEQTNPQPQPQRQRAQFRPVGGDLPPRPQVAEREAPAPELETMVAEAERVLEARARMDEILRRAREKPQGIQLAAPTTQGIELSSPGRGIELKPEEVPQPVELTAPGIDITPAGLEVGGVEVAQQGLDLEAAPHAPIAPLKPEEGRPPKLVPVQMIEPLGGEFYMIKTGTRWTDATYHQLDKDKFEYTSLFDATAGADQIRRALITDKYSQVVTYDRDDAGVGTFPVNRPWGAPGRGGMKGFQGRLPEYDVERVLELVAKASTSDPPDPNIFFMVNLYDLDDLEGPSVGQIKMEPEDIAAEWGIVPEDFKLVVLKVESTHTPGAGRGDYRFISGAGFHDEGVELTGDYEAVDEEYVPLEHGNIGVDVYTLEPFDPAIEMRPAD